MKITVFTPTYNRADKLPRLFDSLTAQTSYNFEWLVVDDGSVDDTEDLILQLKKDAPFPVRYYKKENGGKHTAYNLALEHAQGEWLVCLDSDDTLTEQAVQVLCMWLEQAGDTDGVVAYKEDLNGKILGTRFPEGVSQLHISDLGAKYGCTGDYVFAYSTSIAKEYPFPVYAGERFAPEGVMLDKLGPKCSVSVVSQPLMCCEYQPDGYSAQAYRLIKENPCAYTQCFLQKIDLPTSVKDRVMNATRYQCYRRFAHGRGSRYAGKYKLLVFCCIPMGWALYLYYKVLRGF